jgi:hypothetical protein
MEKRLSDARERMAMALDNHSSFGNSSIVASRPLEAADGRDKATPAADDKEEELVNPKFLKRKLPKPS